MMTELSELSIPERMNMAWYVCDQWAEGAQRSKPALIFDDKKITWSELHNYVNRIGSSFRSCFPAFPLFCCFRSCKLTIFLFITRLLRLQLPFLFPSLPQSG